MENPLITVRRKKFLQEKIASMNKLAKRLFAHFDCNSDYENYMILKERVKKYEQLLEKM